VKASIACEALAKGRRLALRYHGFRRVVEVHAVGATAEGRAVMLVWQVEGGSRGGEAEGWKAMHLDEARLIEVLEDASEAPREGYAPRHSTMDIMTCWL
jgi:hypothetical protein